MPKSFLDHAMKIMATIDSTHQWQDFSYKWQTYSQINANDNKINCKNCIEYIWRDQTVEGRRCLQLSAKSVLNDTLNPKVINSLEIILTDTTSISAPGKALLPSKVSGLLAQRGWQSTPSFASLTCYDWAKLWSGLWQMVKGWFQHKSTFST